MLAMEFQTGLAKNPAKAGRYIQKLAELRQVTGRQLHLVAVGGTMFMDLLVKHFPDRLTVTDATAFMRTQNRLDIQGKSSRKDRHSTDLSELLQSNIDAEIRHLRHRLIYPKVQAA